MGAQVPGGRTKVVIGAIAVAAVAVAAVFAYSYFRTRQTTDGGAASRSSGATGATLAPGSPAHPGTAPPAPVMASVLVFQPSTTATSSTTSIVALDGSVKHRFTSRASEATYGTAYAQSNLLLLDASTLVTVDRSWSAFGVLGPDGGATPAAPSLATLLGGNAHPNAPNTLSNGVTIGKNTLLALESSTSTSDVQFVKIDLVGGATTTLLTARPTSPGLPHLRLLPTAISPDGKEVYLLASDVTINAAAVSGASLVTLDLSTGRFELTTLRVPVDPSLATVSRDGSLIAYEVVAGVNNGYASWATHIYDVRSATDAIVPGESVLPPGGSNGLRFSPDGAYLSEAGYYSAATKRAGMALRVISVPSDTIAQQIDLPGVDNLLQSFGWAGDRAIIYTTNRSSTGNFDPATEAAHRLDPVTGSVFDFPRSLGELIGVLNYQL